MSPRPYAGRGVPALSVPGRSVAVTLPGQLDATLLPDPRAAVASLRQQFLTARGAVDSKVPPGHERPRLTIADVKVIANFVTFALRNDLPTIDPHDAAVIWEKWRTAVVDLRELMRNVESDAQALIAGTVLDHRTWDIEASLTTALAHPREVFEHYCPWRSDWATFERLHPEAV